jgi:Flp pilus assembly protein TadD
MKGAWTWAGWLSLAIFALGLLAYLPSLRYGYVQDAIVTVEENPVVARADPAEIFTSDYWAGTGVPDRSLFRPVAVLTFALEHRVVGGPDPFVARCVNLLFHDLVAILLLLYVLRIGGSRWAAAASALCFAAHPVQLQAVANLVGRSDLLAAGFSVGALLCMSATGRWRGSPPPGATVRRTAAWGCALLVFLALGSKEVAIALPALLVVQEALFRRDRECGATSWWIRRASLLAPTALAVVGYLILRTLAIESFPGLQPVDVGDNVLAGLAGEPRVATTLSMAARYGGLLLFPARLSPDYSGAAIEPESSLLAPMPLAGLIVLLALLACAIAPWIAPRLPGFEPRRRTASSPLIPIAMGSFLILTSYLVVGNVLVLNGAGFAERLLYFPAVGFCAVVALAADRLIDRVFGNRSKPGRLIVSVVLGAALLGAALHTGRQSRMWANNEALFTHALAAAPGSLRARLSLAEIRGEQGRADEGIALCDQALRIAPDEGVAWLIRGTLRGQKGDMEGAERDLRRATILMPLVGKSHLNLGIVFSRTGRAEEAERSLRKALWIKPDLVGARAELAHVLFRAGRYSEAAVLYRECVRQGRADLTPNLRAAEARAGIQQR